MKLIVVILLHSVFADEGPSARILRGRQNGSKRWRAWKANFMCVNVELDNDVDCSLCRNNRWRGCVPKRGAGVGRAHCNNCKLKFPREEHRMRKNIFLERCDEEDDLADRAHRSTHSNVAPSYNCVQDPRADRTKEELGYQNGRLYDGYAPDRARHTARPGVVRALEVQTSRQTPAEKDWRKAGYDRDGGFPVRDQGNCGSCWSFSSAGGVEGSLFAKGEKLNLSVAWIHGCTAGNKNKTPAAECSANPNMHPKDCTFRDGSGGEKVQDGCQGGMMDFTYDHLEYRQDDPSKWCWPKRGAVTSAGKTVQSYKPNDSYYKNGKAVCENFKTDECAMIKSFDMVTLKMVWTTCLDRSRWGEPVINPNDPNCNRESYMSAIKVAEDRMAAWNAQHGPMSIAIDGGSASFNDISDNGIIVGGLCTVNPVLDHAVILVGYGSESGVDYWIIKNSWGTAWGSQGYARLERGRGCNGLGEEFLVVDACRGDQCGATPGPDPTPDPSEDSEPTKSEDDDLPGEPSEEPTPEPSEPTETDDDDLVDCSMFTKARQCNAAANLGICRWGNLKCFELGKGCHKTTDVIDNTICSWFYPREKRWAAKQLDRLVNWAQEQEPYLCDESANKKNKCRMSGGTDKAKFSRWFCQWKRSGFLKRSCQPKYVNRLLLELKPAKRLSWADTWSMNRRRMDLGFELIHI